MNYNIEAEDKGSIPLFQKIFHQKILHSQPINMCFPNRSFQVFLLKPNILISIQSLCGCMKKVFPSELQSCEFFLHIYKKFPLQIVCFDILGATVLLHQLTVSSDHFRFIFWKKNMIKHMIVRIGKNQTNKEMKFSWWHFFI